jgi:hypothetical protein
MTSIIFQNVLDNVFNSTNNINSYFENYDKYKTNIYQLINTLPNEYIVIYIFIVFLLYNFILRFNINSGHIYALLITVIIMYFIINNNYFNFMSYTSKKTTDLKFLHKLMYDNKDNFISSNSVNFFLTPIKPYQVSYLYLNPALIEVFISIKDISSLNISSYVDSLYHSNNVIGIDHESSIGLNRNYLNYNSAILEKNKALNSLNSAIYNLPESYIPKYMKSIKILHGLLNEHLNNIGNNFKNVNKLNGLRVDTVPDDFYDINFIISPNDTKTRDYISTYNMYV